MIMAIMMIMNIIMMIMNIIMMVTFIIFHGDDS
jgi:hypothetical protein